VELFDRGVSVWRFVDVMTRLGHRLCEAAAKGVVVVCDEDAAQGQPLAMIEAEPPVSPAMTGSVTRIRVP
jgi:hypothetical protein